MKRAFVTGGSGFLGGRLIPALVQRGVEVVALARSEDSARKVEALGARAARGALDDVTALAAGMQGCGVVFHAAAQVAQYDPLEVHLRGFERVGVHTFLLGSDAQKDWLFASSLEPLSRPERRDAS